MWRDRCDIIAKENVHSYMGQQQSEIWALCLYLQSNLTELLHSDLHYIQRDNNFFSTSPFDTILIWKQRVLTCINNKTPNAVPVPTSTSTIKRHFRIVRKRHRKGRLKQNKK